MCRRVKGSQIFKQNWNILICSRVIVILLICVSSALGGGGEAGGWGCLGWLTIVYMSSGMFTGKESSNRIKISQLIQDLLNFGDLGSLWLWGRGRRMWGVWGHGRCSHMHADAHTCMHAHIYMYRNCKWPPKWRHLRLSCLTCICMHVCVCMHGTPPQHTNIHPHPIHHPLGGPLESVIIKYTWTNQDTGRAWLIRTRLIRSST